MQTQNPLTVGDKVTFHHLPLTAPERVITGVVETAPWEDPDGTWLHIRDENGVLRTARIEEVVSNA